MVFKHNFIAVVKANGKILREQKDSTVLIPFGSEYSIYMKNQESRKAVVTITIDGEDVLKGHRLVVDANSTFNLEGFLDEDGNVTNRFKFIKKTDRIVKHRGDKIDDGTVRIEYQFEAPVPEIVWEPQVTYIKKYPWYPPHTWYGSRSLIDSSNVEIGGTSTSMACSSGDDVTINYCCREIDSCMPDIDADEGITSKGSKSNQQLYSTWVGTLESNSHVITFKLKGHKRSGARVEKAVLVREKLTCDCCGTRNPSSHRFCCHCGTCLN
jgi:hypothetical protein